jgi:hypothetical protein
MSYKEKLEQMKNNLRESLEQTIHLSSDYILIGVNDEKRILIVRDFETGIETKIKVG